VSRARFPDGEPVGPIEVEDWPEVRRFLVVVLAFVAAVVLFC